MHLSLNYEILGYIIVYYITITSYLRSHHQIVISTPLQALFTIIIRCDKMAQLPYNYDYIV